jgi:hypothetical protein
MVLPPLAGRATLAERRDGRKPQDDVRFILSEILDWARHLRKKAATT